MTSPLRLLWTVNAPPAVVRSKILGEPGDVTQGTWLHALETALLGEGLELAVVWATPRVSKVEKLHQGTGTYYVVPSGAPGSAWARWARVPDVEPELAALRGVVRDYAPQVVHVHGSEGPFGLALPSLSVPSVLSLQGLPSRCVDVFWANLSYRERLQTTSVREVLRGASSFHAFRTYSAVAQREKRILSRAGHVIGRTAWDHAQLTASNRSAVYHHCDEMLREEILRSAHWGTTTHSGTVVFTISANGAWKGTHDLIKAVKLLARAVNGVRLRIAGPVSDCGYGHYLRSLANSLGVAERISWLGVLPGGEIARELRHADSYVLPSYIENSPNSLSEAMYLGVPAIATFAGGIPSLIEHRKTGLLYQPGDIATLAGHLEDLLTDSKLAGSLGGDAHKVAARRHDSRAIVARMLGIYATL